MKMVFTQPHFTNTRRTPDVLFSSFPTRFLPLTVSVIVRVRGKLVRLELEVTC